MKADACMCVSSRHSCWRRRRRRRRRDEVKL
jgi:hypothetical protein